MSERHPDYTVPDAEFYVVMVCHPGMEDRVETREPFHSMEEAYEHIDNLRSQDPAGGPDYYVARLEPENEIAERAEREREQAEADDDNAAPY